MIKYLLTAALGLCPFAACHPTHDAPPPPVTCMEDDPCWDCNTMGNGLCGPDDVTPFAP